MAHALLQSTPSLRLANNAQLNRANVTRKSPATALRISRSASTTPSRFSGLRRANSGNLPHQTLATLGATGKLSRVDPLRAMFEQLTEKAHKVITLSLEEALGHNLAGTEQILFAIITEGAELAKAIGINLEEARLEVEKIIRSGSEGFDAKMPFTARLKRVLELAHEEARQFGHDYVAQEHLLLALLRESEGVACRVLDNLGVDRINLRNEVIRMMHGNAVDSTKLPEANEKRDNTDPAIVLEHIRQQFLLPNEKDSLVKLSKEIGEIWKEMNAAIRVPEEARELGDMNMELNAKLSALADKFEQYRIPTVTDDDIDGLVSAWCDILDEIMEE